MRRLYLQIYLTFVGILLLFGALFLVAWWLIPSDDQDRHSRRHGRAAVKCCRHPVTQSGAARSTVCPDSSMPRTSCARLTACCWRTLASCCRRHWPTVPRAAGSGSPGGPTFALPFPDGRWVLALARHHRAWGVLELSCFWRR
jgi:hypothetical protein